MTALPPEADKQAIAAAKRRGYEPSDVPPRGVALVAIGLLLGIALSLVFVAGLLALMAEFRVPTHRTMPEVARQMPPEPRLEISPEADRLTIETAARRRLTDYQWTDRQAGRARIPIDRAIDILVEKGWPDAVGGGGKPP